MVPGLICYVLHGKQTTNFVYSQKCYRVDDRNYHRANKSTTWRTQECDAQCACAAEIVEQCACQLSQLKWSADGWRNDSVDLFASSYDDVLQTPRVTFRRRYFLPSQRCAPVAIRTVVMYCFVTQWTTFFHARRFASAAYVAILCPPVCLSVCLSNTSRYSTKIVEHRITQTTPHNHSIGSSFLLPKILVKFRWDHQQRRCTWSGQKLRLSAGRKVSGSDALPPRICVHPPRWSASTTVHALAER